MLKDALWRDSKKAALVVICGLIALEIHELCHAAVYWLGGYPVWISFQQVHREVEVPRDYDLLAKAVGPLGSWIVALLCFSIARQRASFFWRTLAFSNVTLRIFPTTVAIILALRDSERGFSDEGDVAFALTESISGRLSLLVPTLLVSLGGSWYIGKLYGFRGWKNLWLLAIYAGCFLAPFLAFLLDVWLGFNKR